jgi:hypothetical protein
MTDNVIHLQLGALKRRGGERTKSLLRRHIEWLAGLSSSPELIDDAAKARQHRILNAWLAETADCFGVDHAAEELRAALARAEHMREQQ